MTQLCSGQPSQCKFSQRSPDNEGVLEALADSKQPVHQSAVDWLGDDQFDPEAFYLERINVALEKVH